MSCGIYKIENKINHKVYIGQSRDIERRWRSHRTVDDNCAIHLALRKYGLENFLFSIVEECDISELDEREMYWIKYYNSYGQGGYNETPGGSNSGHSTKLSIEQVEEITKLLSTNKYKNQELADMFDVSENTISGINTGLYWRRDNVEYPIGKQKTAQQFFCIDCGKPVFRGSIRCKECFDKARRVVERPSKEELFSTLQHENGNFTKVGRLYGVTDNTIRKWCKVYCIPSKSSDYKVNNRTAESKNKSIAVKIEQLDLSTNHVIATFNSITEAERITGICHIREASDPNNHTRTTAGGYKWRRI